MMNKKQTGFTLIELMIAMVIRSFVILGLFNLFINSYRNYHLQEAMSRIQDNARFATDILAANIRETGFAGCQNINRITPQSMIAGLTFTPATRISGDRDGISDSIQVQRAVDCDGSFTVNVAGPADVTNALVSACVPETDSIPLMITDCVHAHIFNANDSEATFSGGTTYIGANSEVLRFESTEYSIALLRSGVFIPSLYESVNGGPRQEVIRGVENMRILYGLNTDGVEGVDGYAAATATASWEQVVAVRIGLLMVSPEDNVLDEPQTYIDLDGDEVTATDKRLRRVTTTTIVLRNAVQ